MAAKDPPSTARTWDLRDPAQLLATGFGLGLLPVAPGTWASAAALPMGWLIFAVAGWWGLAAAAVAVTFAGTWASDVSVRKTGVDDPGPVVIDEIAGQWLVLLAAAPEPVQYGIAFVLFRVFDIAKPWPVSWADRDLKGGLGVMLDDVLAAGYAAAALLALRHWWLGA